MAQRLFAETSLQLDNKKWKIDYFCTPLYLFSETETTIITEAVFSTLFANLLLAK